MENQSQSAEQLVQPTDTPLGRPSKIDRALILALSAIGIVLVLALVFVGIQISKAQNNTTVLTTTEQTTGVTPTLATPKLVLSPTELSIAPSSAATTSVTKMENGWLKYSHQKFPDLSDWEIPWKGFVLYYPSSWKLTELRDVAAPSLNLTITKPNGDYVTIIQAAGGGGYCLFPDQPEYTTFDGMATRYPKYVEINKGNGIIWRLADWPIADDMWSHQLCESFSSDMFKNGFSVNTSIGFTKIKVTNPTSLEELKEILNKIEILK